MSGVLPEETRSHGVHVRQRTTGLRRQVSTLLEIRGRQACARKRRQRPIGRAGRFCEGKGTETLERQNRSIKSDDACNAGRTS